MLDLDALERIDSAFGDGSDITSAPAPAIEIAEAPRCPHLARIAAE